MFVFLKSRAVENNLAIALPTVIVWQNDEHTSSKLKDKQNEKKTSPKKYTSETQSKLSLILGYFNQIGKARFCSFYEVTRFLRVLITYVLQRSLIILTITTYDV